MTYCILTWVDVHCCLFSFLVRAMAVLVLCYLCMFFVFFMQKTAYEIRISDWSSDVCSSDLRPGVRRLCRRVAGREGAPALAPRQRRGGAVGAGQIGRASGRERVCQYV